MAGEVAKPQLRGLLKIQIRNRLIAGLGVGVICGGAYYWFVMRERQIAYKKFYENYDPDKDYERMKAAGIFQSVGPNQRPHS